MKRLIVLLVIVLWGTLAFSAPPKTISYQGYLMDAVGRPVTTATNLTFRLYSSTRTGSGAIWTEARSVTPVNGVYSVELGAVAPLTALSFDRQYFLGVIVGGTELTPRQPLTSAPYALRAATADNADRLAGQLPAEFVAGYLQNLLAGPQTVTGLISFNPLGSLVPFAVDPGKSGMVANLNAEMVGGRKLADLDSRYQPVPQSRATPQQVALVRWDLIGKNNTFPTGTNPKGVVFDGANIWVANYDVNGSVTKLRASDGAVLGTYPVGSYPWGVAFDGACIWTANKTASGTVTKLRASDGARMGDYAAGANPSSIVFDGTYLWVSNISGSTVTKLTVNGVIVGSYNANANPYALAFDGASLWATNYLSGQVTKLKSSDGAIQGTVTVGSYPMGIAFDGSSIWVSGGDKVTRFKTSDGALLGEYPLGAGSSPGGVAFDGVNIWVACTGTNSVVKLRGSDGAVMGTYAVGASPSGLAYDGAALWISNTSSNTLTRIAIDNGSTVQTGAPAFMNGSVSSAALADGAVTTTKIADGAVTDAKISGPLSVAKLPEVVSLQNSVAQLQAEFQKLKSSLPGQSFTPLLPDVIANTAYLDLSGVTSGNFLIINGPGYQIERIPVTRSWGPDYAPGPNMEFPFIFEYSGPAQPDLQLWFDNSLAGLVDPKAISLVIKDLSGAERCRWNLFEMVPALIEPGADGRLRYTLRSTYPPDNTLAYERTPWMFPFEEARNPATDNLRIVIDGVPQGGYPVVEVNQAEHSVTLTYDYNEAGEMLAWFRNTANGQADRRAMSIITVDAAGNEISRRNYYEVFPYWFQQISGFGQYERLKEKIKLSYAYDEDA